MKPSRITTAAIVACSLLLGCMAACTVSSGPSGGPALSFTIGGKTFTLDLGMLFNVQPDTRVSNVVDAKPFEEVPTDTPSSGTMNLRSTSVTIIDPAAPKTIPQEQAISGSATLTLKIDEPGAPFPCDTGILVGTFTITFANGAITSLDQSITLSTEALALVVTNDFTMCLEMVANVQVNISIDNIDVEFGPSEDATPDNDNGNDNANENENENENGSSDACLSNSDCDSDEVCSGGNCVPAGCNVDADCAGDEVCTGGSCVPASSGCAGDAGCEAGETCQSGTCVPASPDCTTDADCDGGQVCDSGACVPAVVGCTDDADCGADEVCEGGDCVAAPTGCATDTDCAADQVCTDGDCVPAPVDDGFTAAVIVHRGSEQIIAGPDVDPTVSTVTPAGYSVTGYKQIALSGDDSKVWFALYDEFPNVEGDQQTQLWSVNLDGSGGLRSALPAVDLRQSISVETNGDGSVCYADNVRVAEMYRTTPGQAVATAFTYWNAVDGFIYGDVRGEFNISDDASRMIYRSFADTRIYSVDLTASPNIPQAVATQDGTNYLATGPRSFTQVDMTADGSRWITAAMYLNAAWTPISQQALWLGTPTGVDASPQVTVVDLFNNKQIQLTDDGQSFAYCLSPGTGINDPGDCWFESVSGSKVAFGDGRTRNGAVALADDGARVFYRTDACCGGGTGILEDLTTHERIATGSQTFAMDWINMRLSDDGSTLVGGSPFGVYVLRDGVDGLPGFPTIENIAYRFATTGEDCKLVVRVTATSPRGIERIFVDPQNDGVDPTVSVLGAVNPLFADRSGGGVNLNTTFTPVEGLTNVWERDVRLTNDVGECVSDLLTSDFNLRVIVRDSNLTMTVFQDFEAVP